MFTKNAMVKFWLTNFCMIDDDTLPGARLLYFLERCTLQLFALHDRYFAFPNRQAVRDHTTPSHSSSRPKDFEKRRENKTTPPPIHANPPTPTENRLSLDGSEITTAQPKYTSPRRRPHDG